MRRRQPCKVLRRAQAKWRRWPRHWNENEWAVEGAMTGQCGWSEGSGIGWPHEVLKGPILIAWEVFAEIFKTTYALIYELYKHRNCLIQDLAQRQHLAGIKQILLKITLPYGDENRQEKGTLSTEPHNTIPGLQDEETAFKRQWLRINFLKIDLRLCLALGVFRGMGLS